MCIRDSIRYTLTKSAFEVRVKIYTPSLRLVKEFKAGETGPGKDKVFTIPAAETANLSRGAYYCVVIARSEDRDRAVSVIKNLIIFR